MFDKLVKQMLCTECKKIYIIDIQVKSYFALIALFFSMTSIYTLALNDSLNFESEPIYIAVIIFLLLLALYLYIDILKVSRTCPEGHGGKKTLIEIDTPEAIEIIKENNLSIPDLNLKKKFPWQT